MVIFLQDLDQSITIHEQEQPRPSCNIVSKDQTQMVGFSKTDTSDQNMQRYGSSQSYKSHFALSKAMNYYFSSSL